MPELPEVETIARGLAQRLAGREIEAVTLHRPDLRIPFPSDFQERLEGARIKDVTRRAKYLLMHLDTGDTVMLHLGMSGTVRFCDINEEDHRSHDHIWIDLDGGERLIFRDPRRFGLMTLSQTDALDRHELLAHLGPEPLSEAFNAGYLAGALKGKETAIKVVLMDQRLVVGVGNIYASEALFLSGVDPFMPAGELLSTLHGDGRRASPPFNNGLPRRSLTLTPRNDEQHNQLEILVKSIKNVLKAAIASGGSTLRDYVRSDGDLGYFQHQFQVYGREGQPCWQCGGSIVKSVQSGRSTFFCPSCQRVDVKKAARKLTES